MTDNYQPIFELTRGQTVESIHFGAAAVVNSSGRLIAWVGSPHLVTFLRSSSKPLQALPLIERGGDNIFHLTSKEIAIICGSHAGTDEHLAVIQGIQAKAGVHESDLLCGTHPPFHAPTAKALDARGESPTPNRHNCSGKHTGMLAHARMRGLSITDYVNPEHPVQQTIRETIAEMCGLPSAQVEIGIDGCSAPNFAMPLYNAALGFARLCDPRGFPVERTAACRRITAAMMAFPDMVGGPDSFDTRLMETCRGRIISKGGAEGYLALGIMPGTLGVDSPGIGATIKIADGDQPIRKPDGSAYNRVRPAAALELLRQLGAITNKELETLAGYGPVKPVTNWRKLVVGESHPVFTLERAE